MSPALIQQLAGGYRLAVDRGAVDAAAFSDLVTAGRRELRDGAAQTAPGTRCVKALALWRGDPLVDAGDAGLRDGADRPAARAATGCRRPTGSRRSCGSAAA